MANNMQSPNVEGQWNTPEDSNDSMPEQTPSISQHHSSAENNNNKKVFHEFLSIKDLVQRGDAVPGIYKACEGTEKNFRIFLPNNFNYSRLVICKVGSQVDENEALLKVAISETCQKRTNCIAVEIEKEDGYIPVITETAKKKKQKVARTEFKMFDVKLVVKCKPADHTGKDYHIHITVETPSEVYQVQPILCTKGKRPRSKTPDEFMQELVAGGCVPLEEPFGSYFRALFPSGVTDQKEEMVLKLFGPKNRVLQNFKETYELDCFVGHLPEEAIDRIRFLIRISDTKYFYLTLTETPSPCFVIQGKDTASYIFCGTNHNLQDSQRRNIGNSLKEVIERKDIQEKFGKPLEKAVVGSVTYTDLICSSPTQLE